MKLASAFDDAFLKTELGSTDFFTKTAFQTAVALAEHEGKRDKEGTILVTDRHLKSVLALSKDFKNYLTELHQGHDEGERARRRQERLDSFGSKP